MPGKGFFISREHKALAEVRQSVQQPELVLRAQSIYRPDLVFGTFKRVSGASCARPATWPSGAQPAQDFYRRGWWFLLGRSLISPAPLARWGQAAGRKTGRTLAGDLRCRA